MHILMNCGGMPFNGDTIKTKSLGGSESAAYYLARELAEKGHLVTLFTNHPEEGIFDGVQYRYSGDVTEATPLGDRYHTYAVATPHDVNITQRSPYAFAIPVAAKVRVWWLHDVPHAHMKGEISASLLGTDLIFAVSEWHKEQIVEAWGINPDKVVSVGNGIDLSIFEGAIFGDHALRNDSRFKMIYSSRPERGLETLVKPNGIMERLAEEGVDAVLYVCSYDNITQRMAGYYNWLHSRCDELPNVIRLGSLTKRELAGLMNSCDLLAYPTTFNETSCITAMEAMASGTMILSSATGALVETCADTASVLLPLSPLARPRPAAMEAGDHTVEVNEELFVESIKTFVELPDDEKVHAAQVQLDAAKSKGWDGVTDRSLEAIAEVFAKSSSRSSIVKQLVRNSDIYALKHYLMGIKPSEVEDNYIFNDVLDEVAECYAFTDEPSWDEHYRKYYEYEKERGVNYGPESLDNNSRFEFVSSIIARGGNNIRVLDYGCAHGHYTVNLAKRFPDIEFTGIDITPSNIEKAKAWAKEEGLTNVKFIVGRVHESEQVIKSDAALGQFDMVIAAEVIEHVANYQHHIDTLNSCLVDGGKFIMTTPYGPWEAQGYIEHWPWRAHVHHFERMDLHDMCGDFPDFGVTVVSSGRTQQSESIGSYVTVWNKPASKCGAIDYDRKIAQLAPRQTVSVCMIAKDVEDQIAQSIKSVAEFADEFVIAIDVNTTDDSVNAIEKAIAKYAPRTTTVIIKDAQSPLDVGFDVARNNTVVMASGDWILWMDADEVIDGQQELPPLLRNSMFDAYAVPHHHFTIEPAGVLKTDYPCRLFRNGNEVRFFGVVHEHPEVELNAGIPYTAVLAQPVVAHYGYTNEKTRRLRFNRNYPLMKADREKYPDRKLGKFLWIRDLSQIIGWKIESGSIITDEMASSAVEGIALWEELLKDAPLRLVIDSLDWYSSLVEVIGGGTRMAIGIKSNKAENTAQATFANEVHANALAARIMRES